MSRHTQHAASTSTRTIVAAAFAVAGLAVTGAGVYAGLNANATGTQAVTAGTLSLTLGTESGTGFQSAITGLAPGDAVNRFVTLTNGGTLDGKDLTLAVAGTGTVLSSSATRGLTVAVTSCSTSWSVSGGICTASGSTATVLAATPVANLAAGLALTPATIANGGAMHLKVTTALPDSTETVTNGGTPVVQGGGSPLQGLTDTLTFTFNEVQRTATTTNS